MLQITNICKEYRTGGLVQTALNNVSLNLRDNEFVAILGPSGSGKTTLLNIIGGLDRYDSGDLVINGISTKKYKDRDWDSYRNHTIGFVFQSYNLIPHQTILSNVELALTISGIGRAERKKRAKEALEKVGLGNQTHKKPNQLSGGQMQRVAIARALVNDPDILLADEPTGALDSETSVQVMELLKEVARDRLVVMVTHNPELAAEYATRIVKLKDGSIVSDSDVFLLGDGTAGEPEHRNMGKASMSFLTALSLSFNNLRTKKARTLLTSFAGSIGIIGIALILSLSAGVNDYIKSIEEDTLSEYPLQIQSTGFDLTSLMVSDEDVGDASGDGDIHVIEMVTDMFSTMDSNDLESLKKYLDSEESGIEDYTNSVEYSYSVVPQIYKEDEEKVRQVHPDKSFDSLGLGSSYGSNSLMSSMMSTDVFYEMPENPGLYENQYDIKAGRWPENYNECVLVLTSGGGMSDFLLYTLGLRDPVELDEMIRQFANEENVNIPDNIEGCSYEDVLGTTFRIVNSADCYQYDEQYQVWKDKSGDETYMKSLVENGEKLTVVGIVQPAEDGGASCLSPGIGYPASLTEYIAEQAESKEIVKQQLAQPTVNVFTNEPFGEESEGDSFDMQSLFSIDEAKLEQAFGFDTDALSGLSGSVDFTQLFNTENLMNLSDMESFVDLGSIQVQLPDLETINLSEIISNLDISVSADGFGSLAESMAEGYKEYVKNHPEADYSGLLEAFHNYLQTDEACAIIQGYLEKIIDTGGDVTITIDNLRTMLSEIMSGYQQYIAEHELTDPEKFDEYLQEYLKTQDAQAILEKWADQIFGDIKENITFTADQMKELASDLAEGYQSYAQENGLPDPSRMGEHFINYLNTEDGKTRLAEGIAKVVDMESLESQISESMSAYMGSVMASYGSAVGDAIEKQITSVMQQVTQSMTAGMQQAFARMTDQIGNTLENAMHVDTEAFSEAFQFNMNADEFTELMFSMSTGEDASYDNNLRKLGYVDFDVPSAIDIYPKDFESKEAVIAILDGYNMDMQEQGKEEQVITYTDVVGTLMSSVTDIIDIISYVLIAFVAISLVVSSIMIGVITYISVLERKKEIGILRAIGASKGNISQVFNAETFIIGLGAGIIGIGITLLLLIPANALIHHLAGSDNVNAVLSVVPAVILILLSVILTLTGGLIPSRKAAKSDPVTALRTE